MSSPDVWAEAAPRPGEACYARITHMVPALLMAAALGSGLGLELTVLTPEVPVGGEIRLRAVLRAERRTELTPDMCGRLGERDMVVIRRDGPEGAVVYHEGSPGIFCDVRRYGGRSRRGGTCAAEIALREGWTKSAAGEFDLEVRPVASSAGVHTFSIEYLGLTSNPVRVRAVER